MQHFDFSGQRSDYLRRSTPGLPEDMRRLIDEAVAAGRITHVPRGVSGLPEFRYAPGPGKASPWVRVVRTADGSEATEKLLTAREKHRAALATAKPWKAAAKLRSEAKAQRRSMVADMVARGMDLEQITAATGWHRKTVRQHLRAIWSAEGGAGGAQA